MVDVIVRVARRGKAENWSATMEETGLETLVDYYEGDVGTVLSVHDTAGKRLYKSIVEAWEA